MILKFVQNFAEYWQLILAVAAMTFLVVLAARHGRNGGLDGIKSKTVGDGQHGTARWATQEEIKKTYHHVLFRPQEWRKGVNLPEYQGLILGSEKNRHGVTALVDSDDIHCLMIGASGVTLLHWRRIVETCSPPMLVTKFSYKRFRRLSYPEHDKPVPTGYHWHCDEELQGKHRLHWSRCLRRSRLYH